MVSSWLKTFSFILYGVVTFLLLCAALVIIFKDDKPKCTTPNMASDDILKLINGTSETNNAPIITNGTSSDVAAIAPKSDEPFDFTGEYVLDSSDNFDEFLSELGIGYFTRLAATAASSRYYITKDGDTYTLKTVSTFGTSNMTFKDGEEFDEDRLDGKTVKTTINVKGNKWIQTQRADDDTPDVHIVREFLPGEIKVTSVVNSVASVRIYKKV